MSSGHVADIVDAPQLTQTAHRLCAAAAEQLRFPPPQPEELRGSVHRYADRLLDYLVGARQHGRRHFEAQRRGGLEG